MDELQEIIQKLSGDNAKSLLLNLMYRIQEIKESKNSQEEKIEKIYFLYEKILNVSKYKNPFEREYKKVHLVCGESQAGSLKVGLDRENMVIGFPDFFAEGPIWELHKKVGQKHRHEWLRDHLIFYNDYFEDEYQNRFSKTIAKIEAIPEHLPIVIWTAENANEQIGLRFFMYLLKDKSNDIYVINTTFSYLDLFQSEEFYSEVHTGEVPPEKLNMIFQKTITKSLTAEERTAFEKEWVVLSQTVDVIRILENNKIIPATEDFLDESVISVAQKIHAKQREKDFIKAGRIIGEVFAQIENKVSDAFLEYRLRSLIYNGVFEIKGIPKGMQYYSVKLR
ncbi:MAG TPA: DUF1835 domain-containing protein [Pseudoneobacillus sp.]|nr:DUF1835 domain-containing protein [Pseudoneobacillus sp.]